MRGALNPFSHNISCSPPALAVRIRRLIGAVVALYTTFIPVRRCVRKSICDAMLSSVQSCRRVNPRVMGVRLHALDGGPKAAELTLEGVCSLLEVLGAIVRGLERPLRRVHHGLLWNCLIPMHGDCASTSPPHVFTLFGALATVCVCVCVSLACCIVYGV